MASTLVVMKFVMVLLMLCQHQVTCESDDNASNSATKVNTSSTTTSTRHNESLKQTVHETKEDTQDEFTKPSLETADDEKDTTKDGGKRAHRDVEIFRKLYLQKRAQHIAAVDSLLETYEYEKTYQMIDLLLTRMRTVVGSSRTVLIQKGFEPGMTFPTDDETKEALSVIMENAGLFGDMALKLPDITHSCLDKKKTEISDMLKWAITYSQDVGFLDDLSNQMFNLASQELDIIPKDPSFINPFRQQFQFQPPPPSGEKKKKAKVEKKRGPRVTKVEL